MNTVKRLWLSPSLGHLKTLRFLWFKWMAMLVFAMLAPASHAGGGGPPPGGNDRFTFNIIPLTQSVLAGSNAVYTLLITAEGGKLNSPVNFYVDTYYLPTSTTTTLQPQYLTNSGSSLLTITTTPLTPPGTYDVYIEAYNNTTYDYYYATLIITNNPIPPGPVLWTKGSGTDTNWSTGGNWTNVFSGGNKTPGRSNDVFFVNRKNDKTIAPPGVINNVVDAPLIIGSLNYTNANGAHTTLIANGVTLTITSNASFTGLTAGAVGNPAILAAETNTITGTNGTLLLDGRLQVTQGASQNDAHNIILDMSSLGALTIPGYETYTYTYTYDPVTGIYTYYYYYYTQPWHEVSIGGAFAYNGTTNSAPCGTLFLAQTNSLALTRLAIGDNSRSTNISSTGSALYLGKTNSIVVGELDSGMANGGNTLLAFKPGLTNPVAVFRGTNAMMQSTNGAVPIGLWSIVDNSGAGAVASLLGTNDFTGGYVDILANVLRVGRGTLNNPRLSSTGVLTFNNGLIAASDVHAGEQAAITGGPGFGIINVGTNATLTSQNIWLTYGAVSSTPSNSATLNISGTVNANTIDKAGGVAKINLGSGGVLNVTNTIGKPSRVLGTFSISGGTFNLFQSAVPGAYVTNFFTTNATLRLSLNPQSPVTNMIVKNFVARGTNNIVLDDGLGSELDVAAVFPLVSYTTFNGSAADTFIVSNVPEGYSALVINNTARKTIELSLALTETVSPHMDSIRADESAFYINLAGGMPNASACLLSTTNLALPLSSWTRGPTNLFDISGICTFTNLITPGVPQRFFQVQGP
jgi:hypothetical protein